MMAEGMPWLYKPPAVGVPPDEQSISAPGIPSLAASHVKLSWGRDVVEDAVVAKGGLVERVGREHVGFTDGGISRMVNEVIIAAERSCLQRGTARARRRAKEKAWS